MATNKTTIKGRASSLMSNARRRCKDKGVEIHLHQAWVEKHLERGTCELTGIPFSFEPPPPGVTRRQDAPSLDRINKHKPYTEENTRVILWAVNCALAEYGTETMLPILEAMVKGIQNAQAQSATSLPTGNNKQGEVNSKLGALLTPRIGEDDNDSHHHCGADAGKDADHSPQESGGDSMGQRSKEVGAPQTFKSSEDIGIYNPTYSWLEY